MKLHLLEHDPIDLSDTNMTNWARAKGYPVSHTYVCNNEKILALDDFDWLMVMGGSPHVWEEDSLDWLAPEKEFFIRKAIGWVLREYSKSDPDWVADFVVAHRDKLSSLSQREAMKVIRKNSGDHGH